MTAKPATLVIATDRDEDEPCEAGTIGCSVAHAECDHDCEAW